MVRYDDPSFIIQKPAPQDPHLRLSTATHPKLNIINNAAIMPWPIIWTSASTESEKRHEETNTILNRIQDATNKHVKKPIEKLQHDPNTSSAIRAFTQPQTILATAILTTACLGLFRVYRKYLRRIPEATNIPQSYLRKRSIFGKVTSVGDGDNFRIYHTPGGWLAGWGWLPWRKVPFEKKELKNRTIHIRLAGVDAPELAHFGRPSQPHAQESLDWLTKYVAGRRVRAYVHRADQYSRVVATAYVWKGLFKRDVGLQMLRAGMATVYEAKTGVEFGEGLEEKYRSAEQTAKMRRKGMWAGDERKYESPRQYKNKYSTGNST